MTLLTCDVQVYRNGHQYWCGRGVVVGVEGCCGWEALWWVVVGGWEVKARLGDATSHLRLLIPPAPRLLIPVPRLLIPPCTSSPITLVLQLQIKKA